MTDKEGRKVLDSTDVRMLEEYRQLSQRIDDLSSFIATDEHKSLCNAEQLDQKMQHWAMSSYRAVLLCRIERRGLATEIMKKAGLTRHD